MYKCIICMKVDFQSGKGEELVCLGWGYVVNDEYVLWLVVLKFSLEHECFVLKFMF